MNDFVADYMDLLYKENIEEHEYSYIWAILNKAFDAEPGDIFNTEENGYYYTRQINYIDPDKISDQIVINLIAVCIIRNNGKFKDYFLTKFPELNKILQRAKPLDKVFQIDKTIDIKMKNKYMKDFNIYYSQIY